MKRTPYDQKVILAVSKISCKAKTHFKGFVNVAGKSNYPDSTLWDKYCSHMLHLTPNDNLDRD